MTTKAQPHDTQDDLATLTKRPSIWKTAPIDAAVLLAILAVCNWLISKDDPGWQRLNPTPWLVLPFFLGGRYGAAAGLVGALLAAASVLLLQWSFGNMTPQALFTTKPYYFLALVLGAAVGTLIHRLVAGPSDQLRRQAIAIADRNQRFEEDIALYRANESRLQQALLLEGAENLSLPSEIQRLFAGDHGRFDDGLLELFTRDFGVIAAAIYRDETGRHPVLTRAAVTSASETEFPETLPNDAAPLAEAALSSGKLATWQSSWDGGIPKTEEGSSHRPHLAAIPWQQSAATHSGPRAVLLIARMEFGAITWDNFARIEAVLDWCLGRFQASDLGAETKDPNRKRLLSNQLFARQIEIAHRLEKDLHLPGRLILFAANSSAPSTVLETFAERLGNAAAPGDPVGAVGDGKTIPIAIGVLSPVSSHEAADQIATQLLRRTETEDDSVKHHVFSLTEAIRIVKGSQSASNVQAHAAAPTPQKPAAAPEAVNAPASTD
ncbi:MAG: hypothetical protein KDN19_05195 [Verrucomicrobiae bacterium]|nr:hypothetical protein [Verrucomicrobiae bacterium]